MLSRWVPCGSSVHCHKQFKCRRPHHPGACFNQYITSGAAEIGTFCGVRVPLSLGQTGSQANYCGGTIYSGHRSGCPSACATEKHIQSQIVDSDAAARINPSCGQEAFCKNAQPPLEKWCSFRGLGMCLNKRFSPAGGTPNR